MVLHNIKLPVCGIYVDKFNIIKYWWSKQVLESMGLDKKYILGSTTR